MYREDVSLPVANMWRSFFESLNDLREEERATFIESITQLMTPRVEFLRTPKASLAGHTQRVNSVAFSPDGQTLVSASQDESAKLWDLQTQTAVSSYRGPTAPTYTAFSPTGASIVLAHHANPGVSEIQQAHPTRSTNTAAAPATITVWSPQSGQQLTAIAGHDSDVAWLSFSPDGKKLASASLDLTARVWDTETGAQLLILKGHAQSPTSIATGVWTVAFSPDGKMLATGGSDRTVRLWEAETGRELKTLSGHRLSS
jgi:WD40 repeat protein